MSDAGGKKVDIWEGIIDEPGEWTRSIKETVERGLAVFEQHNGVLLDRLRIASKPLDPNKSWDHLPFDPYKSCVHFPFDPDKAWDRLLRLAQAYLLRQAMTPATKRKARLREFAEALGRARGLGEQVRQDHIGSDLFSEWFDGLPRDPRGRIVPHEDGSLFRVGEDGLLSFRWDVFPEIDLKKIVENLSEYQAAVLRAADDVPTANPGPAAVLPRLYIRALAEAFQEITGRKAGAGQGPFARFVMQFRAALDPSYKITDENGDERIDESVIDAIRDALRKPRAMKDGQQPKVRRRSTK